MRRAGGPRSEVVVASRLKGEDRSVVEVLDQPWSRAMATLARTGLADAELIVRRPAELSDGQRARLAFAVAMARAENFAAGSWGGRVTVIVDEFASTLDRPAARLLCRAVRRWMRRVSRVRLIVASAHGDLESWLRPDLVWRGR